MKTSTRVIVMGAVSLLGLVVAYGVIFCFYAAGLFGDGSHISAALWEKALRGTILLGPFLGAFLLLGFLAWRERWWTGVLPWASGSAAVILLARRDAGILSAFDFLWVGVSLVFAARSTRREADDEDGGSD
ncbi:MAG: hypothetical protein ABIT01_20845 [Thermoanaerobaculia bacterium]